MPLDSLTTAVQAALDSPSPQIVLKAEIFKDWYGQPTQILDITDDVLRWGEVSNQSSVAAVDYKIPALTLAVLNVDGKYSRTNSTSFWTSSGGFTTKEPEECILRATLTIYAGPNDLSGVDLETYVGHIINTTEKVDRNVSTVEIETILEPLFVAQSVTFGKKHGPVDAKYIIGTGYTSLNTPAGVAFPAGDPCQVTNTPNLNTPTGASRYYNWDWHDFVNHYSWIEVDSVNTKGTFFPCSWISRTNYSHTYGGTTDKEYYAEEPDEVTSDGGAYEYHFWLPLFYQGIKQARVVRDIIFSQAGVDATDFEHSTDWTDMETYQGTTRTYDPLLYALCKDKTALDCASEMFSYFIDGLFFMVGDTSELTMRPWQAYADETDPYVIGFDEPNFNLEEIISVDVYSERLATEIQLDYGSTFPTRDNSTWLLEQPADGGDIGKQLIDTATSTTRERTITLRRPWFAHYAALESNEENIAQQFIDDYFHVYETPIPRFKLRCNVRAIGVEPADVIALDVPELGFSNKKLVCVGKNVDLQTLKVTLTCFDREFTRT